jgi:hypothetical protein
MRNKVVIVTTLGVLLVAVVIARAPKSPSEPLAAASAVSPAVVTDGGGAKKNTKFVAAYGKLPLAFEANHGQTNSRVKFLSRGPGYTLFLTSTEAVLALQNHSVTKPRSPGPEDTTSDTGAANVTELRMNLLGARPTSRVEALELLPSKSNYFIGNDPAKWRTNVPTYASVKYKDVYPGVDLVYYGNQGQLEYDFVVAPGADPTRIQLSIEGAEKLDTNADGDLVLRVAGSEVQLRKPAVYQQVVGGRKEIASRYLLRSRRVIGFEVAAYDANRSLVIDPVLSYSTYLGGSNGAFGNAIAVDSAGNAYVTGGTTATDFPTKNPAQSVPGGNRDVFVSKFDPTGSTLIYSTYLGGTGDDAGNSIALDSSGNAYVTGLTQSLNFPTKNPIQATFGGRGDAFVAKLDSTGSVLVYSTYLGGSGGDSGNGIAVDASGNAYVTGRTGSINFPTKNPLQPALAGGDDAFVAKLDPAGSTLVYSTYLGGSLADEARGIAVDAAGNAYVTGDTSSADFPTKSPFQVALGGTTDAFLAKLNPNGSALVYSTYLGGGAFDQGNGIAVDALGSAYVTGQTSSTNFPTKNAFQGAFNGSASKGNAFVAKFDPTGSALAFSTYLGGSGNQNGGDIGEGIAVDSAGNIYVTGLTSSTDFPLSNPIQSSFVTQSCDFYYGPYTCGNTAFVTEFNATGSALIFSTYVGSVGGNFEDGRGIGLDAAGNAYVAGFTPSTSLLVTPGAFQLVGNTNGDAFIAKISPTNAAGFSLSSFSLTFGDEGVGGTSQRGITVANTGSAALSITSIAASGDFAVAPNNTCGSGLAGGTSCTINVTFNPAAAGARSGTVTFTDSAASSPQTVQLSGNGISGLSATLAPSTLNFNSQTLGTTSPSQAVSLNNTGSATLTISGVSISGPNASDFVLANTTNNCGGSVSLGVGASCTVSVAFSPQAVGNLSATLEILDNSAQSPRTVALAGVGLAPPTVTLSPTSLNFPAQVVGSTSAAQTVTVATSASSGVLANISINASSNFSASNNCGGSVAGGGSCSITVAFTPTASGNLTGTLVVASNAANGVQMVSLSGLGTDFSVSPAAGSQSSATVVAGQSASYTVSVVGTAGFNGTVSLACTFLAIQSGCSVSPSSLMVSGVTPVNATVTVTTKARSSAALPWRTPPPAPGLRFVLPWLLLLLGLLALAALRRLSTAPRRAWLELAIALLTVALFFGCGGSNGPQNTAPPQGTPAGAYQITVDATTAGVTRTTTLALNVQ